MNKAIKCDIEISKEVFKEVLDYFDINEKNTIIKFITLSSKLDELKEECKDHIIDVKPEGSIKALYVKNMNYEELSEVMATLLPFTITLYKTGKKYDLDNLKYDVCINSGLDKIDEITINTDKYDSDEVDNFIKEHQTKKGLFGSLFGKFK